jgi:methyl-accepting chemotaxis protein
MRGFPDVVGSWADRLHPEDADATFNAFNGCLNDRSGRTGYDVAYRLKMKDGAYRWFRAIGGVSRGASGVAERACGSLIDIHVQRTSEQDQVGKMRHSEDISRRARDVSRNVSSIATETADNMQTVAAAAEELAASIRNIRDQANRAASASANASSEASTSAESVRTLVASINKIDEVLKLIEGIASQTNLLALNATIEAARAGDAGKGFAVVANEVKLLAVQTASATTDIAAHLSSIQTQAQNAVSGIERISSVNGDVQDIASSIAEAVSQQNLATQEISERVNNVATQTSGLSKTIQDFARDLGDEKANAA